MVTSRTRSPKRVVPVSAGLCALVLGLYVLWFMRTPLPDAPPARLATVAADEPAIPESHVKLQPNSVSSSDSGELLLPAWIEHAREADPIGQPQWCKTLMESPRERPRTGPLYRECGRPHNEVLCADGKPMFFGSHNQDMFTWAKHFRYLNRPGVFLDIASNDPVSRSNTFFYERCLGWTGVCVEANPYYYDLLRSKRTCPLVKRCISDKPIEVEFVYSRGEGGIATTHKNKAMFPGKRVQKITCVRADDVLRRLRVKNIDFMSLDVEGHELMVLKGIDWTVTKINVITVENRDAEIREFLEGKGYKILPMEKDEKGNVVYGAMWNDLLYVHSRVTWGKPE